MFSKYGGEIAASVLFHPGSHQFSGQKNNAF
jgi:hypothetical protein